MRRPFTIVLDSELIKRIKESYSEALVKLGKEKKIGSSKSFSLSRFCEYLLNLGFAFKEVDEELLREIERYRRKRRLKSTGEAVVKLIRLGMKADEFLP